MGSPTVSQLWAQWWGKVWAAIERGDIPAQPCTSCGRTVEMDRIVYMQPVCHACLPPPPPMEVEVVEVARG